MSPHTPGPWYWTSVNTDGVSLIDYPGNTKGRALASIYTPDPDEGKFSLAGADAARYAREEARATARANARLIAAAPKMLEALRHIAQGEEVIEEHKQIARALLKEIEG